MNFIVRHEDGAYTVVLSHGRTLREAAPRRKVTARPYSGGSGAFLVVSEGDDK